MKIQILCQPENITPRLKYTIDFIFSTLGFNWKIVSVDDIKDSSDLVIGYLKPGEVIEYNKLNLINIPDWQQLQNLEKAENDIVNITVESEKIPILGKRHHKQDLSNWRKSSKWNYFYKTGSKTWQIEFDLFVNVFYHLSRFEERWRNFVDESESDWAKSILTQKQNLQIPTVDILLNFIKNLILLKAQKTNQPLIRLLTWPQGEKFGVAFTHDVDLTRRVSFKEKISAKGKMALFNIVGNRDKKAEIESELEEKNKTAWSFSEIVDFYKKRNWKATFFFMAKTFEGRHLRYNIASEKFNQLFNYLKSEGHEIALHPSLKSFDNPGNYAREKKKLEKYSATKIDGMRQHYLRAKYPRLWELAERAGLKYDSSLGYNFQAGFRSGTTFAHKVYNFSKDRQFELIEFPLAFFEYSLPQQGMDEKKSINMIKSLINQVKKYGGLLTVLFHPSNFLQQPYKIYWDYFTVILKEKNIVVNTLSEFEKWFRARRKILIDPKSINGKKLEIIINKPKEISEFSFEIYPDGEFDEKRNIKIEKYKKNRFYCNSNLSQIKLMYQIK